MRKYKIFISSVQKEFKEERIALREYIFRDPLFRKYFDVFLFEDIPARDRDPNSVYLEEVKRSDIYLCLAGNEYGYENEKGLSPTEQEFCEATKQGKTRLLFIMDGNDKKRHLKTQKLIKKAGREIIRRRFSNISELISQVYAALVQYLEDKGVLQTVPFDAAICKGAVYDDVDEADIDNFLETARTERKFPLPQNTSAKKLFAHLNLLANNKLSNAAVLLFCRNPQKFRQLICAEVKCMHFHGVEVCKPIPSYQVYKGSIFEQVDEAVDFVLGKLDRSVTPSETSNASDVAYEIPKMAVREAIVNAIAHRDYTSNAGVQVMLFADRLEVWNPGSLPSGMTLKSLRTAHASIPRNPLISEPLFWARYIERAGTGTLDMIALCRKAGIQGPIFEQRDGQFVLTIRRKKGLKRQEPQPMYSTITVPEKAQDEAQEAQVEAQVELLYWQVKILRACVKKERTGRQLLKIAGYQKRTGNFKKGIQRLLERGYIALTIPDKPNSRLQKYRLTARGQKMLRRSKEQ